jgi:nicotinamide-nucleotide amidase
MNAQIISIGDELISGQTVDTNAAWLAEELAALGIRCPKHVTIADDLSAIAEAILTASHESGLVIVTGGLGPTPDDVTRDALAAVMNVELRLHAPSLRNIEAYFNRLQRRMTNGNTRQAMLPNGSEAIENSAGTAPGIMASLNESSIYCLPGVPYEMKTMFQRSLRPRIAKAATHGVILHRVLRSFGMSEAALGEALSDLMQRGRNPQVGTSADELIISIRLTAKARTREDTLRLLETDTSEIRRRLGEVIFGEGDDTLAHAVGRLLVERHATICTAESCTGGLIAKCLTDVPGASRYLVQGVVTYADEAKHRLLEIPAELIQTHGAVSRPVAKAMAANARRLAGTDYALAATGIAGPGGATPTKPVGLVYIALAGPNGTSVKEFRLGEHLNREQIRDRAAKVALNLLRIQLIGQV